MGGTISSSSNKKQNDYGDDSIMKFTVLGLFSTGKTTLVHRLKHGKVIENPYHSFDVDAEMLSHDGLSLSAFDYGSRGSHRFFSKLACDSAEGIIYMVDSTDFSCLEESLEFLNGLLQDEISSNWTVMVVANKQDLGDAVGPEVIEKNVKKICKVRKDITMFVMPMSATAEDDHSLQLAFRLFVKTMKRKRNGIYHSGLIPRAWKKAKKMAEDSDNDDENDDVGKTKDKNGSPDKQKNEKKKSFFKNPIHIIKSILNH